MHKITNFGCDVEFLKELTFPFEVSVELDFKKIIVSNI